MKDEPKKKLHQLFIMYFDGALLGAAEAVSAKELRETMAGTYDVSVERITVGEAARVPFQDLERLTKFFELKTHLFNMGQMQLALRAAKSGLHLPGGIGPA